MTKQGKYKRKEDFTDEEWRKLVIEAWRLRAEKGWGRVKIAKALGISPNTVGSWLDIPRTPTKKVVNWVNDGIFKYQLIYAKKLCEEEGDDELVAEAELYLQLMPHFSRKERMNKEGDDSDLIYA